MLVVKSLEQVKTFESNNFGANAAAQWGVQIQLKEAEKRSFKSKIWKPKISSFVIKKAITSLRLSIFQESKVYWKLQELF